MEYTGSGPEILFIALTSADNEPEKGSFRRLGMDAVVNGDWLCYYWAKMYQINDPDDGALPPPQDDADTPAAAATGNASQYMGRRQDGPTRRSVWPNSMPNSGAVGHQEEWEEDEL